MPTAPQGVLAAQVAADLGLDTGYLSRILRKFETRGWLARTRCEFDGRQHWLQLTVEGEAAFRPLQNRSITQAQDLLSALQPAQRDQLMAAMETVRSVLEPKPVESAADPVKLRTPVTGVQVAIGGVALALAPKLLSGRDGHWIGNWPC